MMISSPEVDICTEDGTIERIQSPAAAPNWDNLRIASARVVLEWLDRSALPSESEKG